LIPLLVLAACATQRDGASPAAPRGATAPVANAPAVPALPADPAAARWRATKGQYYKRTWGFEVIGVNPVSSGYMLAFRYKILDAKKAEILNDKRSKAYLVDEVTQTVLAVPTMENIGELRPGSTPDPGRSYFMIFGNPGKVVHRGSRVTFVSGNFRIEGLIVE
jgi:hypothetical protein